MKKMILLMSLMLIGLAFVVVACSSSGYSTGTTYSNPTSTYTPTPGVTVAATVGGSGTSFTNANPTITHGQSVIFDSTLNGAHTVYLNGFSGTTPPGSGCGFSIYTSFPVTVAFPTAGTYGFHCSIHSTNCNTTSCTGCTGMVGTITVN